jgi:tetratricopeptide (TPR) repeat protein
MPETRHARPQTQTAAAMALHAKFNQGLAVHQQGKLADAARIYGEVLQQQPNHFDALHLLGVIAAQTKKTELAVELITKAIRLNANAAAAHSNLGIALQQLKRPGDALASYDTAIALKPDFAEAHYNRGIALRDLKRPGDALASYDTAIALKPDNAEAHYNRGNALRDLKRPEDALASYDKAIALRPDHADAYNNRGAALLDLKRFEEALASCDKAVGLEPGHADAHNNRGNALRELQHPEEALASHDTAIALKPDFAQAHYNRGIALTELKRSEEALASYDDAIALKPDYAEAHWNQSLGFLLMGRFEQGWRQFEWRKKLKAPFGLRLFTQPVWLGAEDVAGKTLFIYWEQGLGDTIQFCRYAKLAQARGAKVVLSVQQPLVTLLKELSPTIRIIGPDEVPGEFDYHCPLLSLPLALGTTVSNIPAAIPYLKSNGEKSLVWKQKLGERNKPRVGLVWSGGFRPNQTEAWNFNSRRDIPLAKLAVLKNPNIAFYSLQKGEPAESDLAGLIRDRWDGPDIIDFTSGLHDFSDTAALMANLDLIISVDTSTAHLAGALGKPVWILNRFDTCWRWFLLRTDSPWYPTVKLYRQEQAGRWDDVVEQIKTDLTRLHPSED